MLTTTTLVSVDTVAVVNIGEPSAQPILRILPPPPILATLRYDNNPDDNIVFVLGH